LAKVRATRVNKTQKQQTVCDELAKGNTYAYAAGVAQISTSTLYKWLNEPRTDGKEGPNDFRLACDMAENAGTDVMEQEAIRRAIHGVQKPVFYKGKQLCSIREYSDTLLIFLLNGRRPEKFKYNVDHKHKHEGKVDHNHVHEVKEAIDFDAIKDKRLQFEEPGGTKH